MTILPSAPHVAHSRVNPNPNPTFTHDSDGGSETVIERIASSWSLHVVAGAMTRSPSMPRGTSRSSSVSTSPNRHSRSVESLEDVSSVTVPSSSVESGDTCQTASRCPRSVASLVPHTRSHTTTSPSVDAAATSTSSSPFRFGTNTILVTEPPCVNSLVGSDDPNVHAQTLPSVPPATTHLGDAIKLATHPPSHPLNRRTSPHPVPRVALSSHAYANTRPSHPPVTHTRPRPGT